MTSTKCWIVALILLVVGLVLSLCCAIFKETAAYVYLSLMNWMFTGAGWIAWIVGFVNKCMGD